MAELRDDAAPSRIFARGLLDGVVAVVAGPAGGQGSVATAELRELGATVAEVGDLDLRDAEAVDAAVEGLVSEHGRIDVLVIDVPGNGAEGGAGGAAPGGITPDAFHDYLDLRIQGAWHLCHAAATKAFIPQEAGKIVCLSPPGGDGGAPENAVRAAVENMMRTLSIEWARFGIRTVAIAPGTADADAEIASLVAFLASPAGDFHSGSVISLGSASNTR